ncbi:MAG: alpha/beta hydrolase-fold protein [Clostridium sp.]|uniref:alpha/beta hydrolase n=1 Tax=Clostridium sp. TaxID=1506 RepID=UPI00303387EE
MERSLEKSKVIINLEEEIKKGNIAALQEFWDKIEIDGTPIIEEIQGDNENGLVTFVLNGDEGTENVLFLPPVNSMDLERNKMDRLLETNLWYISYKVRNDVRFRYDMTINDTFDDDWTARLAKLTYDKLNRNKLIFKEEGEEDEIVSYVVMPKAEEYLWIKERSYVPKGIVYEHSLESEKLKDTRRIRVYTPHNYDKEAKPYRFLLLTDGNEYLNVLSAPTVLDNLIADKKIPPIVVIFIDSTKTRREELTCSDDFGHVIAEDLIPWVRENYNISSNPEEGIIGGLSLGGLTASYLGLKHSEIFGNVLSQSGSYWYKPDGYEGTESNCWMSTQFEAIDKLPLKFYINIGVVESKDKMIDTNINLRDLLISKGYQVDFEYFKGGHDYLSWGETLANGLISLIGYSHYAKCND